MRFYRNVSAEMCNWDTAAHTGGRIRMRRVQLFVLRSGGRGQRSAGEMGAGLLRVVLHTRREAHIAGLPEVEVGDDLRSAATFPNRSSNKLTNSRVFNNRFDTYGFRVDKFIHRERMEWYDTSTPGPPSWQWHEV